MARGGAQPRWGGTSIYLGGYARFESLMKLLVGIMGFSILICALLTITHPGEAVVGLVMPVIPSGSGTYVLSLIGGIGGSITMLRGDVAVAYTFTAMFGLSIMLIANRAFHVPGIAITDAQAVPRMAEMLGTILGPFGVWAYSVGFWAAVSASLLGVRRVVLTRRLC